MLGSKLPTNSIPILGLLFHVQVPETPKHKNIKQKNIIDKFEMELNGIEKMELTTCLLMANITEGE